MRMMKEKNDKININVATFKEHLFFTLFSKLYCLNMKILGYWQINIKVIQIKSEPGGWLCKCCFCAYLLFHRGNIIQKNVKLRGSKKLKRKICYRKGLFYRRADKICTQYIYKIIMKSKNFIFHFHIILYIIFQFCLNDSQPYA